MQPSLMQVLLSLDLRVTSSYSGAAGWATYRGQVEAVEVQSPQVLEHGSSSNQVASISCCAAAAAPVL